MGTLRQAGDSDQYGLVADSSGFIAYEDVFILHDNNAMKWLHMRDILGDSWRAVLENAHLSGNEVSGRTNDLG